MTNYNPNDVGTKGTIFGYPYSPEEADLILIPVPWDVTASYGAGTSNAPDLILDESTQLDFSLPNMKSAHGYSVAWMPLGVELKQTSVELRAKAEQIISKLEEGEPLLEQEKDLQLEINRGCKGMVEMVKYGTANFLNEGKIVGLVGGDHSTPLGLIQALANVHEDFGILQIDAHMDLRNSYEGFTYSHASIMRNALDVTSVRRLVQVGIRDYCEEETDLVSELNGKIQVHFDEVLKQERWEGSTWPKQVKRIINDLPSKVYVSFDMDGLEPSLCPNTGTPVPGGISFHEAVYLIEEVVRSGRRLIGFDVSEVGNATWDANVAARVLFRLCACTGVSRGRLAFTQTH